MSLDVKPTAIQTFLQKGGMPADLSQKCTIEPVAEGALAVTYKIKSSEGVFYLKFQDAEGARGAPFLKHLLPVCDSEMRKHAEKRRKWVRKMLDSVIEQRNGIVPKPCYFDLKSYPMALQKLRREKESVCAEFRMGEEGQRLAGMVGTLWKELEIDHIPLLSSDRKDVWNPIEYSPEKVFLCTATIGELQEKSQKFLDVTIKRKIEAGKGSAEEIQEKLNRKLQHEQRALLGYDFLLKSSFPL